MKKIYSLILLAAAALSANAQVVLTYNGEIVDPTKELNVYTSEVNIYHWVDWGDYVDTNIVCGEECLYLSCDNNTNATVTVTIPKEATEKFLWCWPNNCFLLTETVTTHSGTVFSSKENDLQLHPSFTVNEYATYKVIIKVASSTTYTYTVNFIYDENSPVFEYNVTEDPTKEYDDPDRFIYELISGIQSVTATTATTSIITDLQGRRVAQPQAGSLYIQNGRKFIQK